MITTTGNEIQGKTISAYLGIALGIVVRSPTVGQGIMGGLKAGFVGGNNAAFAQVCESARKDAFAKMVDAALKLQADAVIAFRYDATEFAQGCTEVLAYGTAVKLVARA
jgi:uncharacterized protein YbjQ (UPF0145 family)